MVANTVSRTEHLWVTEMVRKGSVLSMEGSSASVNAVANFITAMKRSGYFDKVEMTDTKEDTGKGVQTFTFKLTAEINQAAPQAKPVSAPTQGAAPAKKS